MAGLLLSGCVYVDMSVQNRPVQGVNLTEFKRFALLDSGQEDNELEIRLLEVVRKDLEGKGYIYDEDSPEFKVMVRYDSRSVVERGVAYSRSQWGYNYLDNSYDDHAVVREGNTVTNRNQVSVYMVTPCSSENPTFLWRSSASSSDREGVASVGACLVRGALSHFPGKAGKYSEKMRLDECEE